MESRGDDIYIGSTVNSLAKRKGEHKSNIIIMIGHCNSKILFEKYDDVRIELIEKFACENRMELNAREGYYIRTLECVNKQIAGRTKKEWDENNKEKIKEYYKEYKENKEYLKNTIKSIVKIIKNILKNTIKNIVKIIENTIKNIMKLIKKNLKNIMKKIKNILKNRSRNGIKKIKRKLIKNIENIEN
jgi:gas vesicle protein